MSILLWLLSVLAAYSAYKIYQKVEYARKRAEYILHRRRAAGIPDTDKRPFSTARADALARIAEQKQLELIKTPLKARKPVRVESDQLRDPLVASRLSGIPGTLPGYFQHTAPKETSTSRKDRKKISSGSMHSVERLSSVTSKPPSPKHSMKAERSSAKKVMKRELAQVDTDNEDDADASSSPTKQRAHKRRHEILPNRSASPHASWMSETSEPDMAIPGQFAPHSDQDMSDSELHSHHEEAQSEQSYEDISMTGGSDQEMLDASTDGHSDRLANVKGAARLTAQKRHADDDHGSRSPSSDAHKSLQSSPIHQSKRSKVSEPDKQTAESANAVLTLQFKPTTSSASRSIAGTKRALDTSDDRKPGDEWVDYEGLRWRIEASTHELQRLSDVVELRSKYKMPKDSMHPMAKERHQVIVSKWLTKEEWEDAKAHKLLGYQEAERAQEKAKQEQEARDRSMRKQEILAQLRETSSPNKRLNSYLASKQRASNSLRSAESSLLEDGDRSAASNYSIMSIDSLEKPKPRSGRISLTAARSPKGRASPSAGPYRDFRQPVSSKSASASPLTKTTQMHSP